jgi:protocatechuate 3,4-dioxygenase beta subunit
MTPPGLTRQRTTLAIALLLCAVPLGACTSASTSVSSSPTPSPSVVPPSASVAAPQATAPAATCDPGGTLVEQTEGPYYTPGAPERSTISEAGTVGTPLVLTGHVFDADCSSVAGAVLDVWQADGAGNYDNAGYGLRGTLTTDSQGRYELTTVIPGEYPGRTEHVHVKVTAPGGPTRTTQLYFPDAVENESDGIFSAEMLVEIEGQDDTGMQASFDFVLP